MPAEGRRRGMLLQSPEKPCGCSGRRPRQAAKTPQESNLSGLELACFRFCFLLGNHGNQGIIPHNPSELWDERTSTDSQPATCCGVTACCEKNQIKRPESVILQPFVTPPAAATRTTLLCDSAINKDLPVYFTGLLNTPSPPHRCNTGHTH